MKYPKMNAKIKKAWVAALRSGDYQQITGGLKRRARGDGEPELGYCCLGVLAEVATGKKLRCAGGDYDPGFPSNTVAKLCKLEGRGTDEFGDLCYPENHPFQVLAEKNDSGWSFKKIANWIEKYL